MLRVDIKKALHGSAGEMELACSFEIKKGEFLAVTGPSGSGKTTLLRIIAGLEKAEGMVEAGGETWQDGKTSLPPQKRKVGFVFQDYALFPNMNVEENLMYVKKDRKLANELLEMTGLKELSKRYPAMLSGGQKQRVALCRALMRKPDVLLLDEPFSALDISMRQKLQKELLNIHKKFSLTTVMVTHSPSEIYRLADKAILLKNGKIEKTGTPGDILLKTSGSAKFSFEGKILDIVKEDVIYIAVIEIGDQIVEVVISSNEAANFHAGERVVVGTKAYNPYIRKVKNS